MNPHLMRRGKRGAGPPTNDAGAMTLLENGIDFIRAGVEVFFPRDDDDVSAHKYAIVLLFAGILLVLKERLVREHPTLILSKVDDPSGDEAKTVDFDQLLKRLNHHAGVTLNKDDEALLRRVQKLRNRIEHHRVEISLRDTQALVGRLAEFIFEFMRDQLHENLENHISPAAWFRLRDLRAVAERLDAEQAADWRRRASRYQNLSTEERAALAEVEPYHPKHNPDPAYFFYCPQCWEDAVVAVEPDIGVCTNEECGEVHVLSQCLRCGTTVVGEDEFCAGCTQTPDRDED